MTDTPGQQPEPVPGPPPPAAPQDTVWAAPGRGAAQQPPQPSPWGHATVPQPPVLRPLRGLATPLLVLSGLVLLADLASAATSFDAADTYRQAVDEGRDVDAVLTAYDGLGLLAFALLVPTWIVGSLWLARARSNAERIAPQEMRRSPAWTFLGWVVPIVSFWFPKQIVDDSARVAERATGTRKKLDTGWWWAAWIIYLVLGNASGRLGFNDNGGVYPGLDVAIALFSLLAFVAWVRVVRRLTGLHDRLLARGDGVQGDWGY